MEKQPEEQGPQPYSQGYRKGYEVGYQAGYQDGQQQRGKPETALSLSVTRQNELRNLDMKLAAGLISAEEYRQRRDAMLQQAYDQWQRHDEGDGLLGWGGPELVEYLVNVASYVGAAGLGGLIGNRADAATVAAAKKMFVSVVSRWRARRADAADDSLTEKEARDVAYAAALTLSWVGNESELSVVDAERLDTGWRVRLNHMTRYSTEALTVRVDSGDPAAAQILITC